jgi:glucokinase
MKAAIGVDVGGTTTAAGLVDPDGAVLAVASAPTHHRGPGTAAETIVELIESVRARAREQRVEIVGIGLGVPALVDAASGRVGPEVPHVPELAGQSLGPALAERFHLPAFVDNDVNALALGEWIFGIGRTTRSLVLLALGTGLGAGIVLDGRLLRGAGGFAGELGHSPVKFDGPPCWCGGRGCLALYASGRGIAEAARGRGAAGQPAASLLARAGGDPRRITAPLVFGAAADGDPAAATIVEETCQALGAMIGIVVNGLNPDLVIITGGVAASLAALEGRVLAAAAAFALSRAFAQTQIRIVPGDKQVATRGGAALVRYETARADNGRLAPGSRGVIRPGGSRG